MNNSAYCASFQKCSKWSDFLEGSPCFALLRGPQRVGSGPCPCSMFTLGQLCVWHPGWPVGEQQRHLMAWNLTARWAQALHCKCQHMIHKSTDVGCWCSKVKKMRGARSCEAREFTYLISISTFCYDLGDVFGMMQYKSVKTIFLKMISKIRSWL